jgi:hypothetical protein
VVVTSAAIGLTNRSAIQGIVSSLWSSYKAMSNAGTWLVGRLRTRQDRARVLAGLSEAGAVADDLDDQLAALPARAFLVLDDQGAHTVRSRHTLSLLRGPLTRAEVNRLVRLAPGAAPVDDGLLAHPPPLPAGLTARWLDLAGLAALGRPQPAEITTWTAALYARIEVRFDDGDAVLDTRVRHLLAIPGHAGGAVADHPTPSEVPLDDRWLARAAPPVGRYAPLAAWLAASRRSWRPSSAADRVGHHPPESIHDALDDQTRRLRAALTRQPLASAAELTRALAISQPTLSRLGRGGRRLLTRLTDTRRSTDRRTVTVSAFDASTDKARLLLARRLPVRTGCPLPSPWQTCAACLIATCPSRCSSPSTGGGPWRRPSVDAWRCWRPAATPPTASCGFAATRARRTAWWPSPASPG